MSIASLLLDGINKSWCNLSIQDLNCRNINAVNIDAENLIFNQAEIDKLYVHDIDKLPDENEINILNNLDLNNNDMENANLISGKRIFLNNENQINNIDCDLHISKTNDTCIWLEGDTDDIGNDVSYLTLTSNANKNMHKIRNSGSFMLIETGNTAGTNAIGFNINSLTQTAQGIKPIFSDVQRILTLQLDKIISSRELDMVNNPITRVTQITTNILDVKNNITNSTGDISIVKNITMNNNNILDVNTITTNRINTLGPNIYVDNPIDMNNNNINNINVCQSLRLITSDITSPGLNTIFLKPVNMNNNDIINLGLVNFETIPTLDNESKKILCLNNNNDICYREPVILNSTLTVANSITMNCDVGLLSTLPGGVILNNPGKYPITITNNKVLATSYIICNLIDDGGTTTGAPNTWISGITNGSFIVYLTNTDSLNPTEEVQFKIAFEVKQI